MKTHPERHVMPIRAEHVATPDCWCRPEGEVVQSMHGPLGTVWLHSGVTVMGKRKRKPKP